MRFSQNKTQDLDTMPLSPFEIKIELGRGRKRPLPASFNFDLKWTLWHCVSVLRLILLKSPLGLSAPQVISCEILLQPLAVLEFRRNRTGGLDLNCSITYM